MPRPWLTPEAEEALAAAVVEIEAGSAAEVVIAVRRTAGPWWRVPLALGSVTAWLTLAFMLFGTPAFPLWSFLVDPVLAGLLAAAATTRLAWPVRWLASAHARRRAAETAARAAFVERGVHHTRARTGVLVYCALAEQVAVVVPDSGVASAMPATALAEWERRIAAAIGRGGAATADAIRAVTPILGTALPRAADDRNELPDAVTHDVHRRPRT